MNKNAINLSNLHNHIPFTVTAFGTTSIHNTHINTCILPRHRYVIYTPLTMIKQQNQEHICYILPICEPFFRYQSQNVVLIDVCGRGLMSQYTCTCRCLKV